MVRPSRKRPKTVLTPLTAYIDENTFSNIYWSYPGNLHSKRPAKYSARAIYNTLQYAKGNILLLPFPLLLPNAPIPSRDKHPETVALEPGEVIASVLANKKLDKIFVNGVIDITALKREFSHSKTIDLSDKGYEYPDFVILIDVIRELATTERLRPSAIKKSLFFAGNRLNSQGLELLASLLKDVNSFYMEHLDLSDCQVCIDALTGDYSIEGFSSFLQVLPTLRSSHIIRILDISNNDIGIRAGDLIARVIPDLVALEELDVSCIMLEFQGLIALLRGFIGREDLPRLSYLDVADNGILDLRSWKEKKDLRDVIYDVFAANQWPENIDFGGWVDSLLPRHIVLFSHWLTECVLSPLNLDNLEDISSGTPDYRIIIDTIYVSILKTALMVCKDPKIMSDVELMLIGTVDRRDTLPNQRKIMGLTGMEQVLIAGIFEKTIQLGKSQAGAQCSIPKITLRNCLFNSEMPAFSTYSSHKEQTPILIRLCTTYFTQLTHLDAQSCGLSLSHLKGIELPRTLKYINFNGNDISSVMTNLFKPQMVTTRYPRLIDAISVRTLVLSMNQIRFVKNVSNGLRDFCYCVFDLPYLTELDLSYNNLKDSGIEIIATAFMDIKNSYIGAKTTLKTLKLNGTRTGNTGAKAIAQFFKGATSLETIELRNNLIGNEGFHELMFQWYLHRKTKYLTTIDMDGNPAISCTPDISRVTRDMMKKYIRAPTLQLSGALSADIVNSITAHSKFRVHGAVSFTECLAFINDTQQYYQFGQMTVDVLRKSLRAIVAYILEYRKDFITLNLVTFDKKNLLPLGCYLGGNYSFSGQSYSRRESMCVMEVIQHSNTPVYEDFEFRKCDFEQEAMLVVLDSLVVSERLRAVRNVDFSGSTVVKSDFLAVSQVLRNTVTIEAMSFSGISGIGIEIHRKCVEALRENTNNVLKRFDLMLENHSIRPNLLEIPADSRDYTRILNTILNGSLKSFEQEEHHFEVIQLWDQYCYHQVITGKTPIENPTMRVYISTIKGAEDIRALTGKISHLSIVLDRFSIGYSSSFWEAIRSTHNLKTIAVFSPIRQLAIAFLDGISIESVPEHVASSGVRLSFTGYYRDDMAWVSSINTQSIELKNWESGLRLDIETITSEDTVAGFTVFSEITLANLWNESDHLNVIKACVSSLKSAHSLTENLNLSDLSIYSATDFSIPETALVEVLREIDGVFEEKPTDFRLKGIGFSGQKNLNENFQSILSFSSLINRVSSLNLVNIEMNWRMCRDILLRENLCVIGFPILKVPRNANMKSLVQTFATELLQQKRENGKSLTLFFDETHEMPLAASCQGSVFSTSRRVRGVLDFHFKSLDPLISKVLLQKALTVNDLVLSEIRLDDVAADDVILCAVLDDCLNNENRRFLKKLSMRNCLISDFSLRKLCFVLQKSIVQLEFIDLFSPKSSRILSEEWARRLGKVLCTNTTVSEISLGLSIGILVQKFKKSAFIDFTNSTTCKINDPIGAAIIAEILSISNVEYLTINCYTADDRLYASDRELIRFLSRNKTLKFLELPGSRADYSEIGFHNMFEYTGNAIAHHSTLKEIMVKGKTIRLAMIEEVPPDLYQCIDLLSIKGGEYLFGAKMHSKGTMAPYFPERPVLKSRNEKETIFWCTALNEKRFLPTQKLSIVFDEAQIISNGSIFAADELAEKTLRKAFTIPQQLSIINLISRVTLHSVELDTTYLKRSMMTRLARILITNKSIEQFRFNEAIVNLNELRGDVIQKSFTIDGNFPKVYGLSDTVKWISANYSTKAVNIREFLGHSIRLYHYIENLKKEEELKKIRHEYTEWHRNHQNEFSSAVVYMMIQLISYNEHLRYVSLANTQCSDANLQQLFTLPLEVIDVHSTSITSIGLVIPNQRFRPALRFLDISGADLAFEGYMALGLLLIQCPNLSVLIADGCRLGRGIHHYTKYAFETHKSLKSISLSNNDFGSDVAIVLCKAMMKNPSLRSKAECVDFSGNAIDDKAVTWIVDAVITGNSHLQVIRLEKNEFSIQSLITILNALTLSSSVKGLGKADFTKELSVFRRMETFSVVTFGKLEGLEKTRLQLKLLSELMTPYLEAADIIFEFFQYVAFPFSVRLPWAETASVDEESVFETFLFDPVVTVLQTFQAYLEIPFVVTYTTSIVIVVLFLLAFLPVMRHDNEYIPVKNAQTISASKSYKKPVKSFPVVNPIEGKSALIQRWDAIGSPLFLIFSVLLFSCSSFLVIPIVRALVTTLDCTRHFIGDEEYWTLDRSTKVICWTTENHLKYAIPSLVILLPFLYWGSRLALVGKQADQLYGGNANVRFRWFSYHRPSLPSETSTTRHFFTYRGEAVGVQQALKFLAKVALVTISIVFTTKPRYVTITLLVLSVIALFLTFLNPPHYVKKANCIRGGFNTIIVFTNIIALMLAFESESSENPEELKRYYGLIFLVGILPAFFLGYVTAFSVFKENAKLSTSEDLKTTIVVSDEMKRKATMPDLDNSPVDKNRKRIQYESLNIELAGMESENPYMHAKFMSEQFPIGILVQVNESSRLDSMYAGTIGFIAARLSAYNGFDYATRRIQASKSKINEKDLRWKATLIELNTLITRRVDCRHLTRLDNYSEVSQIREDFSSSAEFVKYLVMNFQSGMIVAGVQTFEDVTNIDDVLDDDRIFVGGIIDSAEDITGNTVRIRGDQICLIYTDTLRVLRWSTENLRVIDMSEGETKGIRIYKERELFRDDRLYESYVRQYMKLGMVVRASASVGTVSKGFHGVILDFVGLNSGEMLIYWIKMDQIVSYPVRLVELLHKKQWKSLSDYKNKPGEYRPYLQSELLEGCFVQLTSIKDKKTDTKWGRFIEFSGDKVNALVEWEDGVASHVPVISLEILYNPRTMKNYALSTLRSGKSTKGNAYKTTTDFENMNEYMNYVFHKLRPGILVKALSGSGIVHEGELGEFIRFRNRTTQEEGFMRGCDVLWESSSIVVWIAIQWIEIAEERLVEDNDIMRDSVKYLLQNATHGSLVEARRDIRDIVKAGDRGLVLDSSPIHKDSYEVMWFLEFERRTWKSARPMTAHWNDVKLIEKWPFSHLIQFWDENEYAMYLKNKLKTGWIVHATQAYESILKHDLGEFIGDDNGECMVQWREYGENHPIPYEYVEIWPDCVLEWQNFFTYRFSYTRRSLPKRGYTRSLHDLGSKAIFWQYLTSALWPGMVVRYPKYKEDLIFLFWDRDFGVLRKDDEDEAAIVLRQAELMELVILSNEKVEQWRNCKEILDLFDDFYGDVHQYAHYLRVVLKPNQLVSNSVTGMVGVYCNHTNGLVGDNVVSIDVRIHDTKSQMESERIVAWHPREVKIILDELVTDMIEITKDYLEYGRRVALKRKESQGRMKSTDLIEIDNLSKQISAMSSISEDLVTEDLPADGLVDYVKISQKISLREKGRVVFNLQDFDNEIFAYRRYMRACISNGIMLQVIGREGTDTSELDGMLTIFKMKPSYYRTGNYIHNICSGKSSGVTARKKYCRVFSVNEMKEYKIPLTDMILAPKTVVEKNRLKYTVFMKRIADGKRGKDLLPVYYDESQFVTAGEYALYLVNVLRIGMKLGKSKYWTKKNKYKQGVLGWVDANNFKAYVFWEDNKGEHCSVHWLRVLGPGVY